MNDLRLWHGGAPGLRPGDRIFADPLRTAHLVDGCPVCEARRRAAPLPDDDLEPGKVYVTTSREYARIYAAGWPRGDLYRVRVDGPLGEPTGDPMPSWAVPSAVVLAVYDRVVTPTPKTLWRWMRTTSGGTALAVGGLALTVEAISVQTLQECP